MSTLTTSPSPAASPRHPFGIRYTTIATASPSSRPQSYASPAVVASKVAASASALAAASPNFCAHARPSNNNNNNNNTTTGLSPRIQQTSVPTPTQKPHVTDAGTQYTPDGLPPTAGSKRKELSPPPSMKFHTSSSSKQQASAPDTVVPDGPPDTSVATPSRPRGDREGLAKPVDGPGDTPESPSASKKPRTEDAAPGTDTDTDTDTDSAVKVMPLQYETCDPKDLGLLISTMLMELIRLNDTLPLNGRLTRFHSRAPPSITCHDYLQRLIQHATLSPPILLSMVYYIDRLCALYPAFNVSSLTVHRFLITAATVASKGLSDSFWTNPTYARIGGISTSELATLEMEFLQRTQWRIVPKPEVLVDYYVSLVQRSEGYELQSEEVAAAHRREEEEEARRLEAENRNRMDTEPT